MRGESCTPWRRWTEYRRFNPRPACGAKDECLSLHVRGHAGFQSAPRVRGESPDGSVGRADLSKFQSAPRVRGESVKDHVVPQLHVVSIRAPRAGRKSAVAAVSTPASLFQSAPRVRGESSPWQSIVVSVASFNPRPACGAKVQAAEASLIADSVSIRAPRAGRKENPWRWQSGEVVSIRAPRAGRKADAAKLGDSFDRFNPRPACGAKAQRGSEASGFGSFNPRPACGAKGDNMRQAIGYLISFQSAPRVRGESGLHGSTHM